MLYSKVFLLRRFSNVPFCLLRQSATDIESPECDLEESPKTYREPVELAYQYHVLSSNTAYENTLAFSKKNISKFIENVEINPNYESKCGNELLEHLNKVLSSNDFAENSDFRCLSETIKSKVPLFSDEDLTNLLQILLKWPADKRNFLFYDICNAIDQVYFKKFSEYGIDKKLLITDYFSRLGYLRKSEFAKACVRKLWKIVSILSPKQLVQLMFVGNLFREWPKINKFAMERAIERCIDYISAEELGVIALALFKTQTQVTNSVLLRKIYEKLFKNLNSTHPMTLTSYLKLLRYSTNHKDYENLKKLLFLLRDKIDNMQVQYCVHVALLGTRMLIRDEDLLQKVAERFICNLGSARLKDIERMCFALTLFDVELHRKEFYDLILRELKTEKRICEIKKYPRSYTLALHFLSLKGIYDREELMTIFSEKFLKENFGQNLNKFTVPKEIFSLANSVDIEYNQFHIPTLPEKLRVSLARHHSSKVPHELDKNLSQNERVLIHAQRILESHFGGDRFIHLCYVLPHFNRPNIIFCLNEKGKPVEIPQQMRTDILIDTTPPPNVGTWYCVIYLGVNSTFFPTDEPSGVTLANIRQLRKLNYQIALIKQSEWNSHHYYNDKLKLSYLISKLGAPVLP